MAAKKDSGKAAAGKGKAAASSAKATNDSKKRLTQTEIINHLADKSGMKRAAAKEFLNELANLAATEVKRSGEFNMPGFGKLVLSERKAREGRNPATGAKITIPAKTTLKFRLGKAMKDTVGGGK
jgi:DNA-binding protein HU-beta